MNIFLITGLFLLLSCSNETRDSSIQSKTVIIDSIDAPVNSFKDIDYYDLAGIERINKVVYPFFQIEDHDSIKIITLHYGQNQAYPKTFHRQKNVWVTYEDYRGDTSHYYQYQFVLKDRVVDVSYFDTNSYHLSDVSIIKNGLRRIWVPIKPTYIKPGLEKVDSLINSMGENNTTRLIVKDSVLTKLTTRIDGQGRVTVCYPVCFKSNGRSIFWWIYFVGFGKKIDCIDKYNCDSQIPK